MSTFEVSDIKTATISVKNPTARALDYTGFLRIGEDMSIPSEESFTLSPGQQKTVPFPVVMPAVEGNYPVYLDVFSTGKLIIARRKVDEVTIMPASPRKGTLIGTVRYWLCTSQGCSTVGLPGAKVEIGGITTYTDSNGTFKVTVDAIEHDITISAFGYREYKDKITILRNSTVRASFEMEALPIVVAGRIYRDDGVIAGGASIRLMYLVDPYDTWRWHEASADINGYYRRVIDAPRAFSYRVVAWLYTCSEFWIYDSIVPVLFTEAGKEYELNVTLNYGGDM